MPLNLRQRCKQIDPSYSGSDKMGLSQRLLNIEKNKVLEAMSPLLALPQGARE